MSKRRRSQPCRRLAVRVANVQSPSYAEAKLQQDYAATASDAGVLQRPLKEELKPAEVKKVFGYPRNLRDR